MFPVAVCPPPFVAASHFLRLLEDFTVVEETNLAATTCAGRPPAAGGRTERRRTAPHRPVSTSAEKYKKKAQSREMETGSKKSRPLWQQLLGKKQIRRSVLYNSTSSGCQTDAFRSCPPFSDPVIRSSYSASERRQVTSRKGRKEEIRKSDFQNKSGLSNVTVHRYTLHNIW